MVGVHVTNLIVSSFVLKFDNLTEFIIPSTVFYVTRFLVQITSIFFFEDLRFFSLVIYFTISNSLIPTVPVVFHFHCELQEMVGIALTLDLV